MYYIYLLRKKKDDPKDFPTSLIVREICDTCSSVNNYHIFLKCCPGYLSTTYKTVDIFCKKFPSATAPNISVSFSQGMNGNNLISKKNNKNGETILDYHSRKYHTSPISFFEKDHAKTIFFSFQEKSNSMKNSFTFGLLIGSSNMSYSTYYRNTADQGEFDCLFLDEKFFKTFFSNSTSPDDNAVDLLKRVRENLPVNQAKQITLAKQLGDDISFKDISESFGN